MAEMSPNAQKVVKIIADSLNVPETQVTPEAKFIEDLGADSLDTVELVMALEEATGLSIAEEDAANLKTVSDILTYLATHKN